MQSGFRKETDCFPCGSIKFNDLIFPVFLQRKILYNESVILRSLLCIIFFRLIR